MENNISATEAKSSYGVKFIDPDFIVGQLGIQKGMRLADFGCGTGFFSLALARELGEEGTVYALDVLPQRLEAVASSAKSLNLANIVTKRVNLEQEKGSGLEPDSVDLVVIKDMLFQNKNKKSILTEARRVLKKGGNVLIIEWKVENSTLGPEKELRISKEALLEIAQQVGLGLLREINAGNFHFGFLFIK